MTEDGNDEKPLSEVSKNLSKIIADCPKSDGVAITVRCKAAAYLVSVEQYENMKRMALEKELEPIFSEFDGLFKALASK